MQSIIKAEHNLEWQMVTSGLLVSLATNNYVLLLLVITKSTLKVKHIAHDAVSDEGLLYDRLTTTFMLPSWCPTALVWWHPLDFFHRWTSADTKQNIRMAYKKINSLYTPITNRDCTLGGYMVWYWAKIYWIAGHDNSQWLADVSPGLTIILFTSLSRAPIFFYGRLSCILHSGCR